MTTENKVIYSMVGVSKFYDKKAVLKDIYLSYFYGAKIGVIGLNGSGKSSLLRIMAGVDKEINGETVISPGYTVGYLEQEPKLDPAWFKGRAAAEETIPMIARSGRASYLGERSQGHMDPGARSSQLIVSALCSFLEARL